MTTPPRPSNDVPLLVLGITCNTLGITLTGLGAARYVLMITGLGLILASLLRLRQTPQPGTADDAARHTPVSENEHLRPTVERPGPDVRR